MNITLERPPADAKGYSRGDRIILVDGVRWGRTIVTFHGCHGTKYVFEQDEGSIIEERPGTRYPGQVNVRSHTHTRNESGNVEERVIAKIRELVETGKLIDPAKKKEQNDRAWQEYRAERAVAEAEKKKEFENKAREAIGDYYAPDVALLGRVIAAMEWAQTQ